MKKLLVLIPLLFVLFGCPSLVDEIPPDPGTYSPPHLTDPDLTLSGSIEGEESNPEIIHVVLNAIINPETGEPITDLTDDNLIVVEDSLVQGFVLKKVGEEVTAKADIVFIIDATGSMGEEIEKVKESVLAFAGSLSEEGLDVKLGAVTFGDSVREYIDFTEDFSDTAGEFYTFISGIYATGGGAWAENDLDPIYHAWKHFSWRDGAQRIFILITDAPVDQVDDDNYEYEHVCPFTIDMLLDTLRGEAVIHAVCPDKKVSPDGDTIYMGYDWDDDGAADSWDVVYGGVGHPKDLATGTGGRWMQLPGSGEVDLTELPIATTITQSWVIDFETSDPYGVHDVWIQIYIGEHKGEVIWRDVTYH